MTLSSTPSLLSILTLLVLTSADDLGTARRRLEFLTKAHTNGHDVGLEAKRLGLDWEGIRAVEAYMLANHGSAQSHWRRDA